MSEPGPEQAFLAIADISGYTSYLARVELDHAQDILSDLTVTVVEAMAPLQLLKLEGDAVFSYIPGDSIDGSVLQDAVEGTYIGFRSRLRDIKQASTCDCNACTRIPDLDLKIVVHHGTIGRQRLMGLDELVGSEVILVHRLLKNEIEKRSGVSAYAFYTQAAVDAASIDAQAQGLLGHVEDTTDAGDVSGWITDLQAAWQRSIDRPRLTIPEERRAHTWSMEWDAPPQFVFDYITSPAQRLEWDDGIDSIEEDSVGGRRGADTVNHCMHGKNAILEHILDWHPPHYWLSKSTFPGAEPPLQLVKSEAFERTPNGRTQYELVIGSVEGRVPADDLALFEAVEHKISALLPTLRETVEAAAAAEAAAHPSLPELPERLGRFLTEPIIY
jgi:hypothetical protein